MTDHPAAAPPNAREIELRGLVLAVVQRPGLDAGSLAPETGLLQVGLDSLDFIQVAVRIKERYGVSVGGSEAVAREAFRSLRTLAAFVEAELRARPA